MKKTYLKRVASLFFFIFYTALSLSYAQGEQSDFMRSIGKIYVVVAVIVVILIGIVLFLIYLDRKLTKLEDQIKEYDQT